MLTRTSIAALFGLSVTGGAACGPQKPAPAANVVVVFDAGDCDEAGLHNGETVDGTCSFDFGTVPSSTPTVQTFTMQNRGTAAANVTATLSAADPEFQIVSTTNEIAAGGEGTIALSVLPTSTDPSTGEPSEVSEELVVSYEPPQTEIHIDLSATGDGELEHLTIDPGECDFTDVNVGASSTCDLTLGNDGSATLHITSTALADNPGGVFALAGSAPTEADVAPGSNVPVSLSATGVAGTNGDVVGHLLVVTNDPLNAQARIALRVHVN